MTAQPEPIRPKSVLVRPRPVADPVLRVLVIPHAGGSHAAFRRWQGHLPGRWELCLVDLPGRGRAAALPFVSSMDDAIHFLVGQVEPLLDRPLAVFGHSLGALLGWALTRRLQQDRRPLPVWLGVSAAHPPGARAELLPLPGPGLTSALAALGGLPPGFSDQADQAVRARIEPRVRADLSLVESWIPPVATVDVPIAAFCGIDDRLTDPVSMADWSARTSAGFSGVHEYRGGHFYFGADPGPLLARIVADLSSTTFDPGGSTLDELRLSAGSARRSMDRDNDVPVRNGRRRRPGQHPALED